MLITVETVDGEIGYAPVDASSSVMREFSNDGTLDNFVNVIERAIAPSLKREVITSIETVGKIIRQTALSQQFKSRSTAALDIALHDIKGKQNGVPVYELLGETDDISPEIQLYASGGMYLSPDKVATEAKRVMEAGFSGYKYHAGRGPDEDREMIRRVHDAIDDRIDIMVDGHTWWGLGQGSYDLNTVIGLVSEHKKYGVRWIEEPLEPSDHEQYTALTKQSGVPLAGGESKAMPEDLIEFAKTGGVDYLQGDVRQHCGFSGCRKVIDYCRESPVTFVPHHFGTELGLIANAHLAAATPGTPFLEYPIYEDGSGSGMYPNPLATDILSNPLRITDGTLTLPDKPGLGIEVNHDVIERYPYIEGPWTEFIS
ncbi:mandelate racemase/muconate lactonizing enzyme family protein [Haladaptatus caseinilyticus]|uniref:mandelate racemase/muconate lactonizing enzyme family protein n=1 Tax=Haladaptatus caseinilyticus TaxID=2993314 RepID=UPI00224B7BCD|nr:mandelate racemase/muconate lactonizing enzyme family protein [Haladaptatus caseinilyticus]